MGSEEVSEATTYQCTGQPQPADIEACATWLLNDPFSLTFSSAPPPLPPSPPCSEYQGTGTSDHWFITNDLGPLSIAAKGPPLGPSVAVEDEL